MNEELVCSQHGPYPAYLRTCPVCSGQPARPPAPIPLDEDDLPTDLGRGGSAYSSRAVDGYQDDNAPTQIPAGRRPGGRILDNDENEDTMIPRHRRDIDETQLDVMPTGALAILWVKEGQRRGHIYKIRQAAVIGRKEGDIILDDAKVSNPHAKIVLEDGCYVVWDFGSKNGTYVNGEKIRAATNLKENDTIRFGDTNVVLKIL